MNNKTWQQTGKGQYALMDVPYTGYNERPNRPAKRAGVIPLFFAGFAAGILLALIIYFAAFRSPNSLAASTQKKIGLLESVIDKYYMGDRDEVSEADGIYKGIVGSLGDRYAEYFTRDELKQSREENAGEFSGIIKYWNEILFYQSTETKGRGFHEQGTYF